MIKNLLKQCEEIALNPKKTVCDYIEKKNIKAIGMIPLFGPEELVDAAGMLPVGLWGSYDIEINLAKEYFPPFCASAVMAIMELGLNGTYNMLSGVIIPGMTDSLISLSQNWRAGVKNIPLIFMAYPQNRKLPCGMEYLEEELKSVKEELEKIRGSKIEEEEIQRSIQLYNEHRAAMREFDKLASTHPNTVNNRERSVVFKSAFFMPKREHLSLIKQLNEELKKLPEEKYPGKRIIVTGIMLDDRRILDILEEHGMRIVGDSLVQESVQYGTDVPQEGKNSLEQMAKQWRDIEGFTAAYDPFKLRGKLSAELCEERNADGAIYASVKFSDLDEFDMPIWMQDLQALGHKVLSIEVDQQDRNPEQIKTRIQAFSEIL